MHDRTDELFYVLEGELRLLLDGTNSRAPAGTFVVPSGTSHAWVTAGTIRVRMLVHFLPSGLRGFEVTSPLVRPDPPDLPALAAAAGASISHPSDGAAVAPGPDAD